MFTIKVHLRQREKPLQKGKDSSTLEDLKETRLLGSLFPEIYKAIQNVIRGNLRTQENLNGVLIPGEITVELYTVTGQDCPDFSITVLRDSLET